MLSPIIHQCHPASLVLGADFPPLAAGTPHSWPHTRGLQSPRRREKKIARGGLCTRASEPRERRRQRERESVHASDSRARAKGRGGPCANSSAVATTSSTTTWRVCAGADRWAGADFPPISWSKSVRRKKEGFLPASDLREWKFQEINVASGCACFFAVQKCANMCICWKR